MSRPPLPAKPRSLTFDQIRELFQQTLEQFPKTFQYLRQSELADMKEYEPVTVVGPDGKSYRIPKPALEDWNAWLELARDGWVAPLYAKVED